MSITATTIVVLVMVYIIIWFCCLIINTALKIEVEEAAIRQKDKMISFGETKGAKYRIDFIVKEIKPLIGDFDILYNEDLDLGIVNKEVFLKILNLQNDPIYICTNFGYDGLFNANATYEYLKLFTPWGEFRIASKDSIFIFEETK